MPPSDSVNVGTAPIDSNQTGARRETVNNELIRQLITTVTEYLASKSSMVNHREVIKEVVAGVEHSWVYYIILILAGLIALLGLLTNSAAVVIGAMLISPLMGPIISSGLAFAIGDLPLARRAFRTIAVSVGLTVLVTAFFSFISPLNEPTTEIMSRVRPNVFDMFVAVLSGIVGAIALCTKRNYLITATGVAVATAVIPPLSVTGYGIGTGQFMLAGGGFLLFFTNFVAIVLTSDFVFLILGFRSKHTEVQPYSSRKRLLIIFSLLTLISIPLVYTLVVDIQKVKEKKIIEKALKGQLNREKASRMTGYSYLPQNDKLIIRASVNTVKYLDAKSKQKIEQELAGLLKRPLEVMLEQVIVASEDVYKKPVELPVLKVASQPTPQIETSLQIRNKVTQLAIKTENELSLALAPFPVSDVRLTFGEEGAVQVSATIKRDYPLSNDEQALLSRVVEKSIELPVTLSLTTVPLLPPLQFDDTGNLSPLSTASLEIIKQFHAEIGSFRLLLESPSKNDLAKLSAVKQHLIRNLAIPNESITIRTTNKLRKTGAVTLRLVRK
jgi:uncharacterized hydrophobic protein (TIGR00271 family)